MSNAATDKHQHQQQRLLQQVERLNEFLEKEEPKIGKARNEIQSNLTDHESAKLPSSPGGIQGYNAQALVDGKHQVIVQAETFNRQAQDNLAPMLKSGKKNMQAIGKPPGYFQGRQFSADSNYDGLANLALCQAEQLDAYIPDLQFRKRDPRFLEQPRFKNGIHRKTRSTKRETKFTEADFRCDAFRQIYVCPQARILKRAARSQRHRYRVYAIYRARRQDCAVCPVRSKCLSQPTPSRRFLSIEVGSLHPNLIEPIKSRIDTPEGRKI